MKFVRVFIFLSHAVATGDSLSSQKYGTFCPRAQPENLLAENYEEQLCFVRTCVFVYVEIEGENVGWKESHSKVRCLSFPDWKVSPLWGRGCGENKSKKKNQFEKIYRFYYC